MGLEMVEPIQNMGLNYLFATVVLAGVLQFLAGVFKFGKFVRLIPHPVMMGFVNGLAIVIFMSQLGMFTQKIDGESVWLVGSALYTMIGLVVLTMAIMYLLPKITTKVPAALAAILTVSAIAIFGGLDVSTVGSFIRDGGGAGWPRCK